MSKQAIVYNVLRSEAEAKDYSRFRRFFLSLTKDNFQELILIFDGYNEVVEELYEIEEVRTWTRELINLFPHIFFFIEQQLSGTHRMLLLNTCEIESVFYQGELKKPISEMSIEEFEHRTQESIVVKPDNDLLEFISIKTLEYGAATDCWEHATTVVKSIHDVFSYQI